MVGPVPNQTLFSGKSVPGSLHSCLFLRYYHIHDPIQSVRLTWCLAGFDLSGNCRRHWRKCGKTAGRPYVSDEPLRRRLPGSSADTDGRDTDRNEYREPPAPPAGAPVSYLLHLLPKAWLCIFCPSCRSPGFVPSASPAKGTALYLLHLLPEPRLRIFCTSCLCSCPFLSKNVSQIEPQSFL